MSVEAWATIIAALIGVVGMLLVARLDSIAKLFKSSWFRAIRPFLKFALALASLTMPNALFIGFPLYVAAIYYWETPLEFIITNPIVFAELVASQTILVSVYSFLWGILLYPKIRPWFGKRTSVTQQPSGDKSNREIQSSNETGGAA